MNAADELKQAITKSEAKLERLRSMMLNATRSSQEAKDSNRGITVIRYKERIITGLLVRVEQEKRHLAQLDDALDGVNDIMNTSY